MEHTGNERSLPETYIWRDAAGLETRDLGRSAGSQKLYVNLDSVPPGALSTKYHSHSQQEEFFYILSGTGTLRLNGETRMVQAGDFLCKPAGEGIAHTFCNTGATPLLILDVGTVEKEDTCYYPDEQMYLHKSNGIAQAFHEKDLRADWSSEPNR